MNYICGQTARERVKEREERRRQRKGGDLQNNLDKKEKREGEKNEGEKNDGEKERRRTLFQGTPERIL